MFNTYIYVTTYNYVIIYIIFVSFPRNRGEQYFCVYMYYIYSHCMHFYVLLCIVLTLLLLCWSNFLFPMGRFSCLIPGHGCFPSPRPRPPTFSVEIQCIKALSTQHNKTSFTHVWNGFHVSTLHPVSSHAVPPETFRRVGFKQLRFIEHTCGSDILNLVFDIPVALLLILAIRGLTTNSSVPTLYPPFAWWYCGEKETEWWSTPENEIPHF